MDLDENNLPGKPPMKKQKVPRLNYPWMPGYKPKEDVVTSRELTPVEPIDDPKDDKNEKPRPYMEELEEEADKLGGRYLGILYPKFMLYAYYLVYNDKWSFGRGGNPENFIDHHLGEWVSKIPHKDIYLQMLVNSIKSDKNLLKILCLRLNYALNIGIVHVSSEIKIHRNKSGNLLFQESTALIGDEIVYTGKLESSKLEDEELDEWAKKFYSNEETISQSRSGLPDHVLQYINKLLTDYNYDINMDREKVYEELNMMNKMFIEEGLVARVAYLVITSISVPSKVENIEASDDQPKLLDDHFSDYHNA